MKNKVNIYRISALLLTLILTVVRTISLKSFYAPQIGYFNSSPIVTVTDVVLILGAIWFISSAFAISKNEISVEKTSRSLYSKVAASFTAIIFLASAVFLFFYTENKFSVLAGIFTFLSAIYFISVAVDNKKLETTRAFLSMLPTLAFLLSAVTIYFDMKIAMNSPHKIMSGFAMLCAMLFSLCETRVFIERQIPRVHFAMGLITFTLGFTYSASTLIYLLTEKLSDFQRRPVALGNVGFIGIVLAFSIYALSRCFAFETTVESSDSQQQKI